MQRGGGRIGNTPRLAFPFDAQHSRPRNKLTHKYRPDRDS
jgi:hypothetical protein